MIQEWAPQYEQGAIDVIRTVYEEYNFMWDEDSYHADLYNVPTHYLANNYPFWVAVVDGRVIGTVALEIYPTIEAEEETIQLDGMLRLTGTDCSLMRLYVHPEGRGKGIGSKLLQTAIDYAKQKGLQSMEIWSDKRFHDAHRLYDRFGAKVVSERICDDPDESPEWGLILKLV